MATADRKGRPAAVRRTGAGRRRTRGPSGPRVRSGALRISHAAAARIRAGHPWIFRDSVLRAPAGLAPGAAVPVVDEDGAMVGHAFLEPEGVVAARIFDRTPDGKAELGRDLFEERFRAAADRRNRSTDLPETARRVFHGDGEGLPGLAVDRYGDFLVVHRHSRALAVHEAPLVEALAAVFEPRGIYVQDRTHQVQPGAPRPPARRVHGCTAPAEVEVEEDGLRFGVDVSAPVSPGLFLDLRLARRLAERLAPGRRVLNLFSFTGAFGLRAVRAGAAEVVQVDASARAHAAARKNLARSGLDPGACEPVVGDVFKHLARFAERRRRFDLVVVDPPPFSKVGRKTFSALDAWPRLVEAVAGVVAPGGLVLAVKNAAGLDEQGFLEALGKGAGRRGRAALLLDRRGLPPDFPVPAVFAEGRYLDARLLELA